MVRGVTALRLDPSRVQIIYTACSLKESSENYADQKYEIDTAIKKVLSRHRKKKSKKNLCCFSHFFVFLCLFGFLLVLFFLICLLSSRICYILFRII
jgi:hypothetical protein